MKYSKQFALRPDPKYKPFCQKKWKQKRSKKIAAFPLNIHLIMQEKMSLPRKKKNQPLFWLLHTGATFFKLTFSL